MAQNKTPQERIRLLGQVCTKHAHSSLVGRYQCYQCLEDEIKDIIAQRDREWMALFSSLKEDRNGS